MSIGWSQLTFTPDNEAVDALATAWAWLLQEPFVPLLFSALGDVFLQRDSGQVFWLNTGTAELTLIANSVEDFQHQLRGAAVNEWFLPGLVESLLEAGKVPGPGQCYTYVTLPIFAEGKYEVENLNPVPAKEHFGLTGELHQELASLRDGTKVRLTVGP